MDVMNKRKWRVYSPQKICFLNNMIFLFSLDCGVGVNSPLPKNRVLYGF